MRVGEGEDEGIGIRFPVARGVPGGRGIATKGIPFVTHYDGDCCSFVVTSFVEL